MRKIRCATGRGCVIAAGWGVVAGGGCATQPELAAPERTHFSEIRVINESPLAWRLTFRPRDGGASRAEAVRPRETKTVRVAGGADYVVEQAVVTPGARVGSPRSVTVRFDPGESYDWRLATVLTSGDAEELATPVR